MKFAGQIIQIKSDSVWLMCDRRRLDHPGIERQPLQQVQFRRIGQSLHRGIAQIGRPGGVVLRQVRNHLARAFLKIEWPRAWPYWT